MLERSMLKMLKWKPWNVMFSPKLEVTYHHPNPFFQVHFKSSGLFHNFEIIGVRNPTNCKGPCRAECVVGFVRIMINLFGFQAADDVRMGQISWDISKTIQKQSKETNIGAKKTFFRLDQQKSFLRIGTPTTAQPPWDSITFFALSGREDVWESSQQNEKNHSRFLFSWWFQMFSSHVIFDDIWWYLMIFEMVYSSSVGSSPQIVAAWWRHGAAGHRPAVKTSRCRWKRWHDKGLSFVFLCNHGELFYDPFIFGYDLWTFYLHTFFLMFWPKNIQGWPFFAVHLSFGFWPFQNHRGAGELSREDFFRCRGQTEHVYRCFKARFFGMVSDYIYIKLHIIAY